ncbi:amino acid ABC transporter ATP-binding protein [Paenibacillus sp. 1_12]|uniref:amino acid ABC transporter ATP-binding protein n=1 Tax=Paenibacillus sp. 1_12 TaxID=1566278 RepID=UPI000ACE3CAC|nr:amino acid ABC transporter ATP-binding protein [Paenibacillus sp. 1_12]
MLAAKDIKKSFGINEVLKGVSLTIKKGEVVVIVGPSGSGKSTFLRTLNMLESVTSGDILLDEKSVLYRDGKGRRARSKKEISRYQSEIGMVFQNFNLFPHKTVLENIIEGPVQVRKIAKAEAISYAEELLNKVGLYEKKHQHPSALSGGQQQRVAIARALAMKPRIILFDEPTSALDPELVGEVLTVIRDLANAGLTMVIVTHEMSFAKEIGDKIVFMDDGLIVQEAHPTVFFDNNDNPRIQRFLQKINPQ